MTKVANHLKSEASGLNLGQRRSWREMLIWLLRAPFWLLFASVFGAAAVIVVGLCLAPLRYVSAMPLPLCLFVVVASMTYGLVWLLKGRQLPSLTLCVLWALCSALCAWWLYDLVWVAQTSGLLTVGGGDAGHHMAISQQFATTHPKVYVGQTGVHATAWLFGYLMGLELPEAMAWAWIGGAMFFYAAVLGAVALSVRDVSTAGQIIALPLAAGLMVDMSAPYVPVVLHYYQAEGFFAHLHGLAPVGLCLLAAASFDRWWLRLCALTVAVGLLRFTYALNLSEALIALAFSVWMATPWRRLKVAIVMTLLSSTALWGAWIAANKLWNLRTMTGGIMEHDLYGETVVIGSLTTIALCLALAAACARWGLAMKSLGRLGRVSFWLFIVGLGPWLVHHHWDADLSLPRQYYYRKHATLALLALSVGLPAVAAGLAAHITHRFVAFGFVALCIATCHFGGIAVAKQAKSSKRITRSYLERIDPKVPFRINTPLWEPQVMAKMRAVLRREKKQFGGYLHPSWPVHSAMNSSFARWSPTSFQTVVDVKEQRWQEWHHGFAERAGSCRFFSAGRYQMRAYRQHDRYRKAKTNAYVWGLIRRSDLQCWRWNSPLLEIGAQKLCWVCDDSTQAQ
ncbi:MAG TPA: hypothetical protein DCQ06_02160 [Myxococcales bacterium]|nr:hypothetical protein [Myxococcales bacterium]